jgi:hypothetical protein
MRGCLKWILLFLVIKTGVSIAQPGNKLLFTFKPYYNNLPLVLNDNYYKLNSSDSIQFTNLKCYISKIQLTDNGKIVYEEKESYHLLDVNNESTLQLALECNTTIDFDKINFQLGIDSITNVSGAMGGDLDPTRGMYWTWQSGYINLKLEGKSNLCRTRNNEFTFHLGGYQYPVDALQNIALDCSKKNQTIILLDLEKFISGLDLSVTNHIMSPGTTSVQLSEKAATMFKVEQ